jgi:hypothetical protein
LPLPLPLATRVRGQGLPIPGYQERHGKDISYFEVRARACGYVLYGFFMQDIDLVLRRKSKRVAFALSAPAT